MEFLLRKQFTFFEIFNAIERDILTYNLKNGKVLCSAVIDPWAEGLNKKSRLFGNRDFFT